LEEAKKGGKLREITPKDVPSHFSVRQKYTLLGFQKRGEDYLKGVVPDLSSLLPSPHLLHCPPKSLPEGVEVKLLIGGSGGGNMRNSESEKREEEEDNIEIVSLKFEGFGVEKTGEISLRWLWNGVTFLAVLEEEKEETGTNTTQKAVLPTHLPADQPGQLVCYKVQEGEVLQEGGTLLVMEVMKMEMLIPVPRNFIGKTVKKLTLKERTKDQPGSTVEVGDALLEVE